MSSAVPVVGKYLGLMFLSAAEFREQNENSPAGASYNPLKAPKSPALSVPFSRWLWALGFLNSMAQGSHPGQALCAVSPSGPAQLLLSEEALGQLS